MPFLFGLVVIVPIQSYLAIVWRDGSASIPAFTADYWTMQREIGGYDGGFTPGHLWFIFYLFLYSMVAAPLFARWRARTGPRRWVFWYLALMPLVLYVGDAVPWPEDGPQNLFYSFALFVGGFLLVLGAAPGGRDRRRLEVARAGGGRVDRDAAVALDLGDRRPVEHGRHVGRARCVGGDRDLGERARAARPREALPLVRDRVPALGERGRLPDLPACTRA